MHGRGASIKVFVHDVGFSLSELLGCHQALAAQQPRYLWWCNCANNGTYGDPTTPWWNDLRGAVGAEIFLHEGLVQQRLTSFGVVHTSTPTEADLFFVPSFATLSFLLADVHGRGGRAGLCGGSTHDERMLRMRERVMASAAFELYPERHFVLGAAELAKAFFLTAVSRRGGVSFHLEPSDALPTRMATNFTRRMALVNMESSWGLERFFRTIIVAPYLPVGALLTPRVRALVDAEALTSDVQMDGELLEDHRTRTRRPLLLYFCGSAYGHARQALLGALQAFLRSEPVAGGGPSDVSLEWRTGGRDHSPAASPRTANGSVTTRPVVGAPYGYAEAMTRSVFCLAPSGHTCTTRRFYDAVAAGCVPVRVDCLEGKTALSSQSFPHQLNPSSFTVRFAARDIMRDPRAFFASLRALADDRHWLRAMRRNVSAARSLLGYAHPLPRRDSDGSGLGQDEPLNPMDASTYSFGGAIRGVLDELLYLQDGK